MTEKDTELMRRYIYQVIRRLPKDQKDEVALELQELISDMYERLRSMETVLTELGDPAIFADKYKEEKHYLIGPEYYDTYRWFVKVVLVCTLIPVLAVSVIEAIQQGLTGADSGLVGAVVSAIAEGLTDAIVNSVISCVSVFGGVTFVFAIMERQKVKLDKKQEKQWLVEDLGDNIAVGGKRWTPKTLSPIPHKKAIISRGDSIAGIVFMVIFCVLLIFAPEFFSMVCKGDEELIVIHLFNLDAWNQILPFVIISMAAGLAEEILRLVTGVYCRLVMIASIVSGAIQIICCILIFKVFPFWNPDFARQVELHLGEKAEGAIDLLYHVNDVWFGNLILAGIVAIILLEIVSTVYRTLRYGVEKKI